MLVTADYLSDNIQQFTEQALQWASLFNSACCYHSQGNKDDSYSKFDVMLAAGAADELLVMESGEAFAKLQAFLSQYAQHWVPGFLSYDLKNELEELSTRCPNEQNTPAAYFFIPQHLVLINGQKITISSENPQHIFHQIQTTVVANIPFSFTGKVEAKMDRSHYLNVFNKLQAHIRRGDIYEVNLCQEFFAKQVNFSPLAAYKKLSTISPTPFSCYFKVNEHHLLSASPERFLARRDSLLVSQPIKGTAARGTTPEEDLRRTKQLRNNKKEISENLMIVDLVRNDLTRCAQPGSVRVKELLGVYTFKQVHQLISTITAREEIGLLPTTSIKATFPAGSMTGAPKISAMRLIDKYENSQRGIYAGSIGYFAPDGDYDFNVVIRTLLYNDDKKRLSFHVGGAITTQAEANEEYQECLLKAQAIMELLDISKRKA